MIITRTGEHPRRVDIYTGNGYVDPKDLLGRTRHGFLEERYRDGTIPDLDVVNMFAEKAAEKLPPWHPDRHLTMDRLLYLNHLKRFAETQFEIEKVLFKNRRIINSLRSLGFDSRSLEDLILHPSAERNSISSHEIKKFVSYLKPELRTQLRRFLDTAEDLIEEGDITTKTYIDRIREALDFSEKQPNTASNHNRLRIELETSLIAKQTIESLHIRDSSGAEIPIDKFFNMVYRNLNTNDPNKIADHFATEIINRLPIWHPLHEKTTEHYQLKVDLKRYALKKLEQKNLQKEAGKSLIIHKRIVSALESFGFHINGSKLELKSDKLPTTFMTDEFMRTLPERIDYPADEVYDAFFSLLERLDEGSYTKHFRKALEVCTATPEIHNHDWAGGEHTSKPPEIQAIGCHRYEREPLKPNDREMPKPYQGRVPFIPNPILASSWGTSITQNVGRYVNDEFWPNMFYLINNRVELVSITITSDKGVNQSFQNAKILSANESSCGGKIVIREGKRTHTVHLNIGDSVSFTKKSSGYYDFDVEPITPFDEDIPPEDVRVQPRPDLPSGWHPLISMGTYDAPII